jgi:hypothetical protein
VDLLLTAHLNQKWKSSKHYYLILPSPLSSIMSSAPQCTVTFHASLSGFYVTALDNGHNNNNFANPIRDVILSFAGGSRTATIYNVDTGELALTVEGPYGNIHIDSTATKLAISLNSSNPQTSGFEIWSLMDRVFVRSLPGLNPGSVHWSHDSTKLFYDETYFAGKRICVTDVDTGRLLWMTAMSEPSLFARSPVCFTACDEHVIRGCDKLICIESVWVHQVSLSAYEITSGVETVIVRLSPFECFSLETGTGGTAILASGSQNGRYAVLLVGRDLKSTRIVTIPQGMVSAAILPGAIRFGPPGILIVNGIEENTAAVLSYDDTFSEDGDEERLVVHELSHAALLRPLDSLVHFCVHSLSCRMAEVNENTVHIYDVKSGSLLGVYEAPVKGNRIGAVEAGCVLL